MSYKFSGVYCNDLTKKELNYSLIYNILPGILKHVICVDFVNVFDIQRTMLRNIFL